MKYRWQQSTREQPGHSDDWLLTYADMITLLLCFFALYLVVTVAKKDVPHKDSPIQQVAVAMPPSLPQDDPPPKISPNVIPDNPPFRAIPPDDSPVQKRAAEDGSEYLPQPTEAEQPPAPAAPLAAEKPSEIQDAGVPVAPVIAADPPPTLQPPAISSTDALRSYGNLEQKSDRITSLEMSSAAFFDRGSAEISVAGRVILRGVAAQLKSDTYKDFRITVEGHTDDTPIKTAQFPSNWELSTARASAVVHFFLDEGIPGQKLRAAGYADTFPKLPNRDPDGKPNPANQAQNRRVVIQLEKIEKSPAMPAPAIEP